MGGNRKHGYRRGNANGRNGSNTKPDWFCNGCQRYHKDKTMRTRALDGYDYCDRQYYKFLEKREKHV